MGKIGETSSSVSSAPSASKVSSVVRSSSSTTTSSNASATRNDGDTLRAGIVGLVEDDRGLNLSDGSILLDGQDVEFISMALGNGRIAA